MAKFCTAQCTLFHLLTSFLTLLGLFFALYTGIHLATILTINPETAQQIDLLVNHSLVSKEFTIVREAFLHLLNSTPCLSANIKVAYIKCPLEAPEYTTGSSDTEFGNVDHALKYYNLETFCTSFANYQACLLHNCAIVCKKPPGYFSLPSTLCLNPGYAQFFEYLTQLVPNSAIKGILLPLGSILLALFIIEIVRLILVQPPKTPPKRPLCQIPRPPLRVEHIRSIFEPNPVSDSDSEEEPNNQSEAPLAAMVDSQEEHLEMQPLNAGTVIVTEEFSYIDSEEDDDREVIKYETTAV